MKLLKRMIIGADRRGGVGEGGGAVGRGGAGASICSYMHSGVWLCIVALLWLLYPSDQDGEFRSGCGTNPDW